MTMSTFSKFSLVVGALWFMNCGVETPDPGPALETCPDGTVSAHCAPATCNDKQKNGAETDVDCGGPTCGKCAADQACVAGSDCGSGLCMAGVCRTAPVPSCTDGVKNGTESAVDCGGPTCPLCALGKTCIAGSDCASATCSVGLCAAPPAICTDGIKNGTETAVDCGGTTCPKCAIGNACLAGSDCVSATCTFGLCVTPPPTCTDGIKNGAETDVDCGGPTCGKCALTKMCLAGSDCVSATCSGGRCVTPPATCTDGIKNGAETDVDCGGPTCGKCALTKMCLAGSDCVSATCSGGRCVTPPATCTDGIKNGTETDVDCGGPGCGKCALGKMCLAGSDCLSTTCTGNLCVVTPVTLGVCTFPLAGGTAMITYTNPPYTLAQAMSQCTMLKGTFR